MPRCDWVSQDPIYIDYHDHVWGRPVFDNRELFAKLCLDGQQAGLSWLTILKKQANYERLFAHFDPAIIATFDEADVERLMQETGIVRNRLKIQSIIRNAQAYQSLKQQGIDFSQWIWSFVGNAPKTNWFQTMSNVPASTPESIAMSKALKKAGFNFVGPTICYAFMQAVGMVNDHRLDCRQHAECLALSSQPSKK
jgi:DNA-3-methyladenine glycosylase I